MTCILASESIHAELNQYSISFVHWTTCLNSISILPLSHLLVCNKSIIQAQIGCKPLIPNLSTIKLYYGCHGALCWSLCLHVPTVHTVWLNEIFYTFICQKALTDPCLKRQFPPLLTSFFWGNHYWVPPSFH